MTSFISIDGSLKNVGVVMGTFGPLGNVSPTAGVLFRTEKKSEGTEDFINRCNYIYMQVNNLVKSYKPRYIFLESPMGSQNNAAAKSNAAMCMLAGALRSNISSWGGELITVTPIEVKKAVLGKNDASKEEMISWAVDKYPDFPFYKRKKGDFYL